MQRLIDEAFLQRLANLRFIVKGRRKGRLSGIHASPRSGVSLEFSDYRAYAPGDDFRYVDWNAHGRLDRVLVKSFIHEADLPIYLLVDVSASMGIGSPTKSHYASQLAASMAFLGLRELDRVGLYTYRDRIVRCVPARHGMSQMVHILLALTEIVPEGTTSPNQAIFEILAQARENGLVFLISDFLTDQGYEEAIARLLHRGHELVAVQVLDAEEVDPSAGGATQIVDVESARRLALTIGRRTLADYAERLARHQHRLKTYFVEHGIAHCLATTDLPVERLIHQDLRAAGVLR